MYILFFLKPKEINREETNLQKLEDNTALTSIDVTLKTLMAASAPRTLCVLYSNL